MLRKNSIKQFSTNATMLQGVERTIRQGHPKDPQKHGPYYQLSFTWRGKSRTRFVRAERLAGIREKIASYKRFRELTDEWVDLVVELEQQEREQAQ